MFDFATLGGVVLLLAVLIGLLRLLSLDVWYSARAAGLEIQLPQLFNLRFRRIASENLVNPLIRARLAGLKPDFKFCLQHILAGGHLDAVIDAFILAHRSKLEVSLEQLAEFDLGGRDVYTMISAVIQPYSLVIPTVSALSQDGYEITLGAYAEIQLHEEPLDQHFNPAATIAHFSEAIIHGLGQCSHQVALHEPEVLSELSRKHLGELPYHLHQLRITEATLGRNIAAETEATETEARARTAVAEAEEKRIQAEHAAHEARLAAENAAEAQRLQMLAEEERQKLKLQEAKLQLISAEAEMMHALTYALRTGHMTAQEYYQLRRISHSESNESEAVHF